MTRSLRPSVTRRVARRTGLLLAEGPRAAIELGVTSTLAPVLAADKRGDGHPVLVLPGFFQHDLSTLVLRTYLRWLNYSVSGWDLGTNLGSTESVVTGLLRRIRPEEARHLLAELPQLLRERLTDTPAGPDRNVTLGEIERALEVRLNVGGERAAEIVLQIGRALEDTISAGEIEDVQAQLPTEMKQIFESPTLIPGPSSA